MVWGDVGGPVDVVNRSRPCVGVGPNELQSRPLVGLSPSAAPRRAASAPLGGAKAPTLRGRPVPLARG
eukprot:2632950-Pyramimonas_sp.AAC.1